MDDKIDFVITWVDGSDKEWQIERNKNAGKDPEDVADYRYRDWGTLKYLFRGIEKFAPWVNKVFFVTNGQKPEWLNLEYEKLVWVKHEDYIPKEYLPTFSANPIELNFHRINELSEHFVYFNDDTFLTDFVDKNYFFENGLPKYFAQLDVNVNDDEIFQHIVLNDSQLVNRYLKLDDSYKNDRKKWFDNTHTFKQKIKNYFLFQFHKIESIKLVHMASPILKSTMIELWEKNPLEFEKTSKKKFRSREDINQYVFAWYDILRGKFEPFNPQKCRYFTGADINSNSIDSVKNRQYKMICINDTCEIKNFDEAKTILIGMFEEMLPTKSAYEK